MRSRNRSVFDAKGEVHFVTSSVRGFVRIFEMDLAREIFCDALRFYVGRNDLILLGWVLMPDHFHLLLKRNPEKSISELVGNLKRWSSRKISDSLFEQRFVDYLPLLQRNFVHTDRQDPGVWEKRFDGLVITNLETLSQKLRYIHANPVRKGLVELCEDWPYSSAAAYAGDANPVLPVDTEWRCLDCDWK